MAGKQDMSRCLLCCTTCTHPCSMQYHTCAYLSLTLHDMLPTGNQS
jgi:hypothetical protein